MQTNRKLIGMMLLVLAGGPAARAQAPAAQASAQDRARELAKRLKAPCCWRETLDVHESPVAASLRKELRQRLAEGESAGAVEADLVRRYGPGIRASLPVHLGYVLFGGAFLIGALALSLVARKQRAAPVAAKMQETRPSQVAPPASQIERQQLEDRLDEDLEAMT